MACSGCARRREAIKSFAVNITDRVASGAKKLVTSISSSSVSQAKPLSGPTGQSACQNCSTSVTAAGWVNTCTLCGAISDAKPIPHKLKPKCDC